MIAQPAISTFFIVSCATKLNSQVYMYQFVRVGGVATSTLAYTCVFEKVSRINDKNKKANCKKKKIKQKVNFLIHRLFLQIKAVPDA